jgi:hypothetical protein
MSAARRNTSEGIGSRPRSQPAIAAAGTQSFAASAASPPAMAQALARTLW